MEREKLHLFFAGMLSAEEGMEIKNWVEESEEHARMLGRERKLFDAIMLHGNQHVMIPKKTPAYKGVMKQWIKVACIVILTLICNRLYTELAGKKKDVAMNTISVPAGQRTNLTLPDGTNVWLNARSTLQYPTDFNEKKRSVLLKGEAFFNVASNKDIPFVVQTDRYEVEALGTQFDVEAYPDQDVFEATLMSGSIKIASQIDAGQTMVLEPEYKVCITEGRWQVEKVDDFGPYRWKEGLICFKDEAFGDIMKSFEKYYGIKIYVRNQKVMDYSFTGKFRQADGVDYALRILQKDIHFVYEKDVDEQVIYIN